jgi:hypothetical protein
VGSKRRKNLTKNKLSIPQKQVHRDIREADYMIRMVFTFILTVHLLTLMAIFLINTELTSLVDIMTPRIGTTNRSRDTGNTSIPLVN